MPYFVKGTAEQFWDSCGISAFVKPNKNPDTRQIELDLPRNPFLGSLQQAKDHVDIWRKISEKDCYYVQGNMTAGNLFYYLGPYPLKKEDEDFQSYKDQFKRIDFSYISDNKELCGLMLCFRKDSPSSWIIGLIKNTQLEPKDRSILLYTNDDLRPCIKNKTQGIESKIVSKNEMELFEYCGSKFLQKALSKTLSGSGGLHSSELLFLDRNIERIEYLLRFLHIDKEPNFIDDPITKDEIDPELLFQKNDLLDLITEHKIKLSFPLFKECLNLNSQLHQEFKQYKMPINKEEAVTLLTMFTVFYEHGVLNKHHNFLQKYCFERLNNKPQWNDYQINLIPALLKKNYSPEQIEFILAEKAYYHGLYNLSKVDLCPNVPNFLQNAIQIEELKFIDTVSNEHLRRICLIFWFHGVCSIETFKEIAKNIDNNPLLSDALLNGFYHNKLATKDLVQLATNRLQLFRYSISDFYAPEFKAYKIEEKKLEGFKESELEVIRKYYLVLRNARINNPDYYNLIFDDKGAGQLLRMFYHQLEDVPEPHKKIALINHLHDYYKRGWFPNDKSIEKVLEKTPPKFSKIMFSQFNCIVILQKLNFINKVQELVMKDTNDSTFFRHVINELNEHCKEFEHQWVLSVEEVEAYTIYKQKVISIAYNGLTSSNYEMQKALRKAEENLLNSVEYDTKLNLDRTLSNISHILLKDIKEEPADNMGMWSYLNVGSWLSFFQAEDVSAELELFSKVLN